MTPAADIRCIVSIGQNERVVQVHCGISCRELFQDEEIASERILGVRLGNQIQDIRTRVEGPCRIEAIVPGDADYQRLYQQSLCALLFAAAAMVLPKVRFKLGHSLGNGLFIECLDASLSESLSENQIADLSAEMRRLVNSKAEMAVIKTAYAEALEALSACSRRDSVELLSHMNPVFVDLLQIGTTRQPVLGPVALHAGMLRNFELLPYHRGLLLRYPRNPETEEVDKFSDIPLLSRVYEEHQRWSQILGAPSVGRLNTLTDTKKVKEFILIAEALQAAKLASLSQAIADRSPDLAIVLIAGPSSSGKTTFAKRLGIQLQTLGIIPRTISLDNYFVPRDQTPLDEDGEPDFESLRAIDTELFTENLLALISGDKVALPSYDFRSGTRVLPAATTQMERDEVLLIEGIHGLNPALIPHVPKERVFKIYISALTQINIDESHRISTTDNRLLRRLVRDYRYRGNHADATLAMWPSVRRGEDRNIFPYQQEADGEFNSALDYEIGVLKPLAESLLREVHPASPGYPTARRLLELLSLFLPIPREFVPDTSILREFVGGSAFKY